MFLHQRREAATKKFVQLNRDSTGATLSEPVTMENTSQNFMNRTSSRKDQHVVFLNLLVFLAVRLDPVNCIPLKAHNFKIPALGRIAQLGSMYDASTDSFNGVNIFKSNPPNQLITKTQTPRITRESQIITKESDKFNLFGVDLVTSASIQTGIVQPEGAASFLSEDITSPNGVTGVFLQTFQTAEQTLPIFHDELKNYYNRNFELFEEATHIVTGINWGASIAVTFTDTLARKRSSVQSTNILKQEFTKLKRNSGNIDNKASSFQMHLKSDVYLRNALPATLREVRAQINQVEDSIEDVNSGLGVPLKFTLTPISVLKKYLNVTTVIKSTAHKLDEQILHNYFNVINEVKLTTEALLNFADNSNCFSNELRRDIGKIHERFDTAEQNFKIKFKNVFSSVKSGALNNSDLYDVLQNYNSQDWNAKIVRSNLLLQEQAQLKVDFCSQLNEEYPDIQYFGSSSNLFSKIYQNHNKPTYVLFTKSEFKENDRVSYEDNLNIFLNLLYKPTNALFIVDCDFNYAQCESINGTVIKQIRQGNYTFNDVRMEIKIAAIANKTEVVRCDEESGITGAFCVSTLKRASSSKPKCKTFAETKNEVEIPQGPKVVGGKSAGRNEFPFQVIFLNPEIHCGGSILNESFILTAAHCFYDIDEYEYNFEDYKSWTVVAGDHNWKVDEGTEQRRQIQDVYIHTNYKTVFQVNDIAIVKLDRPLQLSSQAQSILLPGADYEATGDAVVTGWGRLRHGGSNPNVLQKVTVPVVDRAKCVEAYEEKQVFVSVKMMCAGDVVDGGVDACQGDSGGPLSVQLSNGSFMLIGIVSSGIGCARAEYPGIYMQVSKYVDWINDTLTNFDKCQLRERCQNGGTCTDGINGFRCMCADGFAGKNCKHLTGCQYPGMCTPTSEMEYCLRCRNGFVKDPQDNTTCKFANSSASLIISSQKEIRMISLEDHDATQIIQNGDSVRGTDYNFGTKTIFWFSYASKRIFKGPVNAEYEIQSINSIMQNSSSQIIGLAVDWIHDHLYWVEYTRGELLVSNRIGTMKKVLFSDNLSSPQSIAVNPLNGWMYWVDFGKNRIERAGLDGSQRDVIINVKEPRGLTVDLVDNRLYWTQGTNQSSSTWSSDFDGLDRKRIVKADAANFASSRFWKIATFDKDVYLLDDYNDLIYKVNKCNGKGLESIYKSNHDLWDIKIYHETIQPKGENVCSKRSLSCSHFCFPVPSLDNGFVSTTTCACPDGLSLSADKRSCV